MTVLGFIPGVTVSYDQAPANVTLDVNWNGIPDTITLSTTSLVGPDVPPAFPASSTGVYAYSYNPAAPASNVASWGLYYGPASSVASNTGITIPCTWVGSYGGNAYGEWFWYTFYPNVGNWDAFNSVGQVSPQPTYDITAQFEYSTSQIWFNHVDFNVDYLQLHKDVSYCTNQTFNDEITIFNAGLVTATNLDLTQTFPYTTKLITSPDTSFTAIVELTTSNGIGDIGPTPVSIASLPYPSTWTLPTQFSSLPPGATLTITIPCIISDTGSGFSGTLVFETVLSANQIPLWKDPTGYAALVYPSTLTGYQPVYASLCDAPAGYCPLFCENILYEGFYGPIIFTNAEVWVWNPLQIYVPTAPVSMVLDPTPVPLIAGETHVTQADVALVRNMMLGLAPYNWQADCSGLGFINTKDLAEYEAAAR